MINTDGKRTIAHHPSAKARPVSGPPKRPDAPRDPVAGLLATAEGIVNAEFARLRGKR